MTLHEETGKTWSKPVQPSTLIAGPGKIWGQRTADGRFALAYRDADSFDCARAVRSFPPSPSVRVGLCVGAVQTEARLDIEICDESGHRPVRVALIVAGVKVTIPAEDPLGYDVDWRHRIAMAVKQWNSVTQANMPKTTPMG